MSQHPKAELQQVSDTDIEDVTLFLEENMKRGIRAKEFRTIFEYPWLATKPTLGYLLRAENKVVGFAGGFFAERMIGGRVEKFCNLTNWCVLPEYRTQSLSLISGIINRREYTITQLTPIPSVEALFWAMRYRLLNEFKLFSLPLAHCWTLLRRPKFLYGHSDERFGAYITEDERKAVVNHEGTGCKHLVLGDGKDVCCLVWKRRKKKGVAFSEILYVRNAQLLLRHFERVKLHIMASDLVGLVAVDERLLGCRPRFVMRYRRVSLYKSDRLEPEQIDNLYSELVYF